jgi:hypothetical protein
MKNQQLILLVGAAVAAYFLYTRYQAAKAAPAVPTVYTPLPGGGYVTQGG